MQRTIKTAIRKDDNGHACCCGQIIHDDYRQTYSVVINDVQKCNFWYSVPESEKSAVTEACALLETLLNQAQAKQKWDAAQLLQKTQRVTA